MKKLKILHIASFVGNIGDNASHIGFYKVLDELIDDYSVEQLEIRKFYKNYKYSNQNKFDEEFIDKANSYDLVVFGGGGFLDYWIPNSKSGTTIDIDPRLLSKFNTKVLITSMGSYAHKDVPSENFEKFRGFLASSFDNDNIHIAVRNDGSIKSIAENIGVEYSKNLIEVLDSGFFYNVENSQNFGLKDSNYVALNIVNDQFQLNSPERGEFNIDSYYKELATLVLGAIDKFSFPICIIPHITSDLVAISKLLSYLDDYVVRKFITIAPCVQGNIGANFNFSIYKKSHVTIASRLHANICSFAMGKKVIGLMSLDRIKHLHESIGSEMYYSTSGGFASKVISNLSSGEQAFSVIENIENKKNNTLKFYKDVLASVV